MHMVDGKVIRDGDTKDILKDKELLESNNLEVSLCLQRNIQDKIILD